MRCSSARRASSSRPGPRVDQAAGPPVHPASPAGRGHLVRPADERILGQVRRGIPRPVRCRVRVLPGRARPGARGGGRSRPTRSADPVRRPATPPQRNPGGTERRRISRSDPCPFPTAPAARPPRPPAGRPPPHARAAAVHRLQGVAEALLDLGQLGVDVGVALAAQPVGLGVGRRRRCGPPRRARPARPRSGTPAGPARRARRRRSARGRRGPPPTDRSASRAGPVGELGVLPAGVGHRALGLVAGLGERSARPRRGRRRPAGRPRPGASASAARRRPARRTRVCSASCVGVVDELVAAVEHVLRVVQLARAAPRGRRRAARARRRGGRRSSRSSADRAPPRPR